MPPTSGRISLLFCLVIWLSLWMEVSSFLFIKSQLSQCAHQWLHPPKTGSTFCLSIQHVCNETDFLYKAKQAEKILTYKGCAKLYPHHLATYKGSRWHKELTDFTQLDKYVTILREPSSRTLSAFCDYMHMDGMKRGEGDRIKKVLREKIASNSPNICQDAFDLYVSYPNTYGCYTKMLNGYGCYANVSLTDTMVETAKHMLSHFSFVGILEEYSLSVDLFFKLSNRTMPVHLPPLDIETKKIRERAKNYCNPVHGMKFCMNKDVKAMSRGFKDPWDSQVYEYARQRFWGDIDGLGLRKGG